MKKITDFIVDKRHIILLIATILCVISAILSSKVKTNYDMAEYLPSTSETRIGMDIMEKEFPTTTSTLNVLLKKVDTKDETSEYFNNLDYVTSIDFEENDELFLYRLTIDLDADSKEASDLYKDIEEHFGDKLVDTSGSVSSYNKVVLPMYIMVLAVLSAIVILIIMCESYLEPFLFLATILIAVILNNGTNIMFPYVSNMTKSISSILQMALSMDYSIMLISRYRQEKEHEKDKTKAMKKALLHGFKAISSSSVTTIVGLLALVFMSFTIGRDLGFVLAKGVLFSLLSIFTCLPTFIIMFDTLITKTEKKTPIIKMDFMGKFANNFKYLLPVLFAFIFIGSFLLKGNLGFAYNISDESEIGKNFKTDNQMVLIYSKKKEDIIRDYCLSLENKVESVLCYSNTINEPLPYNKLSNKLNDFGTDVSINEDLLKVIYYHYYNQTENNKATLEEIVNFIKEDNLSSDIDDDIKKEIDRLYLFSNGTSLNKKRTPSEISKILDMEEEQIKELLILYNSKNTNTKITIKEFITFMNNYIVNNSTYNGSLDSNTKNNLNRIGNFIDEKNINTKLSSTEMAKLFGLDENTINSLYAYYSLQQESTTLLTINEFATFINNEILTNSAYSTLFTDEDIVNIKLLATFSNKEIITQKMTVKELSTLFNINEELLSNIIISMIIQEENNSKVTIEEFINYIYYLKENTNYLDDIDLSYLLSQTETDAFKQLVALNKEYTVAELSNILGMRKEEINSILNLIDYLNSDNKVLSPYELVNILLSNELIYSNLDSKTLAELNTVSFFMSSTINNKTFSYEEISNYLSMDSNTTKSIYNLYESQSLKLSPYEFITFILEHQTDQLLSSNLDKNIIAELTLLKNIMINVNTKYSSNDLAKLLGIDNNTMSLIYSLYDTLYANKNITISIKEFINILINDIMNNTEYSTFFTNDKKDTLNILNIIITNSLNNYQYTKDELYKTVSSLSEGLEKDLIDLVFIYYGSENEYIDSWTLTIEDFVNYLNDDILNDKRFSNYIGDMKNDIINSKKIIDEAKSLLTGTNYRRAIINTKFDIEGEETYSFIQSIKDDLKEYEDIYIIGDSPMSYEMSKSFHNELNFITILTMIFIFIVVAVTFRSLLIPIILVLIIQTSVFFTMTILSFSGSVYFISILIVQSILMGATIDYAILYTSYYLEEREKGNIKISLINAYNNSIHTILTSASILIIATLIVGMFSEDLTAKICLTISEGALCSAILILLILPGTLAACDRLIVKKKKLKSNS